MRELVSWNPLRAANVSQRWICQRISAGCDHCYASRVAVRFGGQPYPGPVQPVPAQQLDRRALVQPLRWRQPRRIVVCSLTDIAHEGVSDTQRLILWTVMAATRRHTYLVLTKRPQRLAAWYARAAHAPVFEAHPWPLPNVWIGVSIETGAYAWRASVLACIPAVIRFVCAEPLLGPLADDLPWSCIDWLIIGGEVGGPPARRLVQPCSGCRRAQRATCTQCGGTGWMPRADALQWVRALRDRARAAAVPVYFKGWGGPRAQSGGRVLDGHVWDEYPASSYAGVEEVQHG